MAVIDDNFTGLTTMIAIVITTLLISTLLLGLNGTWDEIVNEGLTLSTYNDTEIFFIKLPKLLMFIGSCITIILLFIFASRLLRR